MRADMAAYDADPTLYTQSLGAWHGFVGQQPIIAVKKHSSTARRRYIDLSGWIVAALLSEFGPLPDLVREIYAFLRQADARKLGRLCRQIDAARMRTSSRRYGPCGLRF